MQESRMDDNDAIITALNEGDEAVFDDVYRYYFRGLCAFCSQYVTLAESEEIVQDTMMWLWGEPDEINRYSNTEIAPLHDRKEQGT